MVERKPLVSGNWKMHLNHFEAIQLVQKLSYALSREDYEAVDVAVHPPFTDIRSIQTLIDADNIPVLLGAQNCHWEEKGAFTGEVSPAMLAKLDVKFVIVGHSERRLLFGETDEDANRKVKAVLKWGMTPILAVGETAEQRDAGQTNATVVRQVVDGLTGVRRDQVATMVIAYEPVWAIGERAASPRDAQAVCAQIRATIAERFGAPAAETVRIQYGGSVKPANMADFMAEADIDGALIGGASLEADVFARCVQYRLH